MMRQYILLLILALGSMLSCSSDKENDLNKEVSIEGIWNFTELNIDNASSPDQIKLANDIIEVLLLGGCEILILDFNSDKTVIAKSRDFTETGKDVKLDGSGLLIECPSDVETTSSTWSLEGDKLTFVDENDASNIVTIQLNGDTLIIPAEIVDENNLKGAEAIFKRG